MLVFWGVGCPHCDDQKPFLRELEQRYSDLEIREFEVFRTDVHHQLIMGVHQRFAARPAE